MEYFVVILIISFILYLIYLYNKLHQHREPIKNSDATLDASLARKSDLADDLKKLADDVVKHQSSTHEMAAKAVISVAEMISTAPSPSLVLAQLSANYPDLSHFAAFEKAQDFAFQIEERIDQSLQERNIMAERYNVICLQFPANLFAILLGLNRCRIEVNHS